MRGVEWGGGRWRVSVGVIKYFRPILMGHEVFFKIFDKPQDIFLCSISVSLFFKLRKAGAQNIYTSHVK